MMEEIQTFTLDCTTCLNENIDYTIDDQLVIEINDIDDLAIAWIVTDEDTCNLTRIEEDKNGNIVPLDQTQWLWRKGGQHGSGKINITQWLLNHWSEHFSDKDSFLYLAVGIYDFKYEHWLFKGGKWSFNATLIKNGQSIWHKYDFKESDTSNEIYGLQYLKILQLKIEDNKINISETIPQKIAENIFNTVSTKHNYIKANNLSSEKHSKFTEPMKNISHNNEKNGFFNKLFTSLYKYIFDILFIIVALILSSSFYSHEWVIDKLLWIFIALNTISLFYFFMRFKIGGRAWALILRKKHDKELDTFMVVLGLLFTAAFGAITSFDFEASKVHDSLFYIIGIFLLYITTNIVLMYVLVVIETYAINTLKANKQLFMVLMILVGIGIFIQEYINFEQSYRENISKVEICEVNNNATNKK
jgi:hypothetical protein